MEKYLRYTDFAGEGFVPIMSAVTTAVPRFWSLLLFVFWISINGASYFAILKLTGKKRFFHTFTAVSFIIFLAALSIAAMNGVNDIIFLSGYWVAYYLLMIVIGYFLLHYYK